MKEQINWITPTEANDYLYEQLVELLKPEGFTEYAYQANTLLRAREHYIQMVCREIREEETIIRLTVAPLWTYRESRCFGRDIRLKYGDSVAYGRNNYTIIAFKQRTSKRVFYKLDELIQVWDTAISPQLCGEVIDFYDRMHFDDYVRYCEEEGDKTWDFRYTDSESRFFTRGYNCLWKKQYRDGKEYLEKAIAESEKYLNMLEAWGGQADSGYLQDMNTGKEIVEIINRSEPGWEETVQVRLEQLERDTLEKKGIALSI